MNLKPIFYGYVTNGKLVFDDVDTVRKHLSNLVGRVTVTIQRFFNLRSNQENAYYWGVVIKILSDEMGLTPDEVHEGLKLKFLKIGRQFTKNDKVYLFEIVRSTTVMSTVEFENYLTMVRAWASLELNVYIPLPNEVDPHE